MWPSPGILAYLSVRLFWVLSPSFLALLHHWLSSLLSVFSCLSLLPLLPAPAMRAGKRFRLSSQANQLLNVEANMIPEAIVNQVTITDHTLFRTFESTFNQTISSSSR